MMISNVLPSTAAPGAAAQGIPAIAGPDGNPAPRRPGGRDVVPAARVDDRHEHQRSQRPAGTHRHGHDHDEARVTLQVRVVQAFQSLGTTPGVDAGADTAKDEVEASVKLSLSEGGARLRLKLEADRSGGLDDAGLRRLLDGFVDTLQAALHSLFAAGHPLPAAPATTAATVAALPAPATSATAATSAATGTPATVPARSADAPAATAAAAAATAVPAGPAAASTPPAATPVPDASSSRPVSLSMHLSMAYQSFDSSIGSLVGRLARPDAAQTTPDIAPMLQDLGAQFDSLIGLLRPSGGSSGTAPSLAAFLSTLAASFAAPARADTAASADAPVVPVAPATPAPLKFAFSLQVSLRGSLVDATA